MVGEKSGEFESVAEAIPHLYESKFQVYILWQQGDIFIPRMSTKTGI